MMSMRMTHCGIYRAVTLFIVAAAWPSRLALADGPEDAAYSQPAPKDPAQIAENEQLYLCLLGNPNTLNALLMSSEPEEKLKSLFSDYPLVYDSHTGWAINPVMVESYEDAPDRLTSTMKLKPGLRWQDGHALTADDVVFSWQQVVDEKVPALGARTGPDQIADCQAIDPLTVKFTHKAALPTNKWNVMFGLIPKHLYEQGKKGDPTLSKSDYNNRLNRNPVGNGPYKFVEWVPDDKIVFERWDGYTGPKPHFKRVICRIVPEAQTRLLALERQDVDEISLTPQQFALETTSEEFRKVALPIRAPRWNYHYILWNLDGSNPFFADREVRRAMSLAMNYDLIMKQVYFGLYEQSYGIYHPHARESNPALKRFNYDLAAAEKLLDGAGWTKDAQDGWRYKDVIKNGASVRTRFAFTLLLPVSESAAKTSAVFQDDLRKIGIEMKTRVLEWATFLETIRKHEFDAHYSSMTMGVDPDEAWNLLHSESITAGRNYGSYANPRVDELLSLGRKTFDESQRMRYYAELAQIVYDDVPCTFIVDTPNLWALNKRLRGVVFSPRGPFMFHPGVLDWWVPQGRGMHDAPIP